MDPIELRARREALGLSQSELATLLGVKQNTWSQWETGKRGVPDGVGEELARLEEVVEDLVDHLDSALDARVVTLVTYATDADLWEAQPHMLGIPSVLHRVASARCRALASGPVRIIQG